MAVSFLVEREPRMQLMGECFAVTGAVVEVDVAWPLPVCVLALVVAMWSGDVVTVDSEQLEIGLVMECRRIRVSAYLFQTQLSPHQRTREDLRWTVVRVSVPRPEVRAGIGAVGVGSGTRPPEAVVVRTTMGPCSTGDIREAGLAGSRRGVVDVGRPRAP